MKRQIAPTMKQAMPMVLRFCGVIIWDVRIRH
jgi:hypothetical protein